ncbi:glycosyltransferase, partial [Patescibacteria group bacterium]|nr:glycosyltransferase [Patescibacteria group bacterium]MBU1970610.1 glycosyltransferase [Patescibacteria group bacterium]
SIKWDIADGDINLLMQGIMASDFINTVSPSYAAELLRADDGSKINEVLTARKDRFIGILNGLDYTTLPRTIVKTNWQSSKGSDKSTLQQELKLAPDDRPIFAMVSRLDPAQKGLALLAEVVPFIVQQGGQFILLGSGNQEWEARFTQQATELGVQNMSVTTAFDPELALRIYQGSDFFLIPSSFEPCGLTQMIAMWYGSVPIAHATGGLKDTIKHGKTGFLFTDFTAEAFKNCLIKCFNLYKSPAHFAIVEACLGQHFGFDESAKAYLELYEKAVQIRKDAYGPVYL